jgi:DNA-binding CsgD family transcriptional regulator
VATEVVEPSKRERENPPVARTTLASGGGGRDRHDLAQPAHPTIPEIVGREAELDALHAFIDGADQGPAAFVLEGQAGIGKSTLWLAGLEYAHTRGLRVYSSRPAEAERGLAHAGLGDLFEDVLDEVLPALATPRRRALEVALLLEEASGDPVDHRALAVAVRSALQVLSEPGPLLIAVDDVQWLDPSSSSALAFALRRLATNDVLLLLARRVVEEAQPPGLEQAMDAERVQRVTVGPLSVGALHRYLRDRLGRAFARQTLLRIHERSGGNPFFALELARILDLEIDLLQPLRVPGTLEDLVGARISRLPAPTREALALASAMGTASVSLLERAGVAADALEPAFAAQVIERDGETIRFTHPLLSSVLYQHLGADRRRVHERIAGVVEDPLLRARHVALSTDTPDADTAGSLEEAANLAAGRGALAVAAELSEHALRLTPSAESDSRHRRALAAARAYHAAGEWTRARSIVDDLLAEAETGALRAEALVLRAEFEDDFGVQLLEEALCEAAEHPALQSVIHTRLAWATRFTKGFLGALEHARAALELADSLDDDALRAGALQPIGQLGAYAGDAEGLALAGRARDLALAVDDAELLYETTYSVAYVLVSCRSIDAGRELLEREYQELRDRDEPRTAEVLWLLSWVELWGGRWELAADYADRSRDLSFQYSPESTSEHLAVAAIAVHRGQLELARRHAEKALELAETQLGVALPQPLAVLGLLALWGGDAAGAATWLERAARQAATLEWHEPCSCWWTPDHVEALLELGRIEEAVTILDAWDVDASRLGRDWALAHVLRCRGLVAAARGNVDQAVAHLHQAVARHAEVGDTFGQARAMLALGIVLRRLRQKRTAREAIRAALGGFERLGAATWVGKARDELGSIGGRAQTSGLTPAENRVALLVADGRTNREVAAALFLSERTVASHLTHIYAKLGVRSRTELAGTLR